MVLTSCSPSEGRAFLLLDSGELYEGTSFGAVGTSIGEVVFNTSMTGYQEVLTDPSYSGQLVVMTYPHIGNYGVNPADIESGRVQPAGLIIRQLARRPSNFRSQATLNQYLSRAGVCAVADVDTRAVTRRIREGGATMGLIATGHAVDRLDELKRRLATAPSYGQLDYVKKVTVPEPTRVTADDQGNHGPGPTALTLSPLDPTSHQPPEQRHIVVIDYGVKYSILRNLISRDFIVTLVPSWTSAEAVLALSPGAVLLSNGPGNPALLQQPVEVIGDLLGKTPIYGICLGHQLLAQALGGRTFKLKYGHRGANQPVLDLASGKVKITSQNHGYAVDSKGFDKETQITELNLNDETAEGMENLPLRARSVQYHPEAGPGPNDARDFFDRIDTQRFEVA